MSMEKPIKISSINDFIWEFYHPSRESKLKEKMNEIEPKKLSNLSIDMLKGISRIGGITFVYLSILYSEITGEVNPIMTYYLPIHGLADIITGRHHYLPMRTFFGITDFLSNRKNQPNNRFTTIP